MYAGAIKKEEKRDDLKIIDLVTTRENAGRISFEDVQQQVRGGQPSPEQLQVLQGAAIGNQVVGVYVESAAAQSPLKRKKAKAKTRKPPAKNQIA